MKRAKSLVAKSILNLVATMGFGLVIAACYGPFDEGYGRYCEEDDHCPYGQVCSDDGLCVYPQEDVGTVDARLNGSDASESDGDPGQDGEAG